jgi:hypothetical protein
VAAALARLARRPPARHRPLRRRRPVTAPRRPARLLARPARPAQPHPPVRRIAAKARVMASVRASARPGLAPVRPRFAQVRCRWPLARPRPHRRRSRLNPPNRSPVRPRRPRRRRSLRRSPRLRRPPGRGQARRGRPRPRPRRSSSRPPRAPATPPLWCRPAGSRRSRARGRPGWATTRSVSVPAPPRRDRLHPGPARRAPQGSSRRPARAAPVARVAGLPAEPVPAPLARAVLGRTPA